MASLGLTIGALELGVLFSTTLYGIATVQAFLYTERSFKDPLWLRIMIFLVWSSETIHTAFTWVLLYTLTITNYGNPGAIGATHWSLGLSIPLTSIVGASVQVFFAWRVRVLGGRLIIPIIAWAGAILRLAFGITLAVVLIQSATIPLFFLHYRWLVDAQLVLDAAVDFLNTGALCYYLIRRRSDFKATRRVVDKLIFYTVETGLITSFCAVAVLACSLGMPNNFIYLAIFMIYPKLFSNSFFTSLNTRHGLRQQTSKIHGRSGWNNEGYIDTTQLSDIGHRSVALETAQKSLHEHTRMADLPVRASPPDFDSVFRKETLQ